MNAPSPDTYALPSKMTSATSPIAGRDSLITCRNSQAIELRASLLRLNRFLVVFEVYNPYSILQVSEVLTKFRITMNERLVYSGRAVVSNLVNTGLMVVCEASLNDEDWLDIEVFSPLEDSGKLESEFSEFLTEYHRLCAVSSDFKVVVADMETLLAELRRWLEQVELGLRSSADRSEAENRAINGLTEPLSKPVDRIFRQFEEIANSVGDQTELIHQTHIKRKIHPLIMCSPFIYRTFDKPLGYAGDYEMVNMITRDAREGGSLFAKMLNTWILNQAPAVAHRNRISYLTERLVAEARRVTDAEGRRARIFNLGCGPAREVQDFLVHHRICERCEFTLLDFNAETLQHVSGRLDEIRRKYQRGTQMKFVKRSVHQILRRGMPHGECKELRDGQDGQVDRYDFIYCAGLFDYLSDRICKRLVNIFYGSLAPGGLLVVTNVDEANPIRNVMEYLLEWHLIYRDREQLRELVPDEVRDDGVTVRADETGANLFMELRRPCSEC